MDTTEPSEASWFRGRTFGVAWPLSRARLPWRSPPAAWSQHPSSLSLKFQFCCLPGQGFEFFAVDDTAEGNPPLSRPVAALLSVLLVCAHGHQSDSTRDVVN